MKRLIKETKIVKEKQKSLKNLLSNQYKQRANKKRATIEKQRTSANQYIKNKSYVYRVRKTND